VSLAIAAAPTAVGRLPTLSAVAVALRYSMLTATALPATPLLTTTSAASMGALTAAPGLALPSALTVSP